MTENVTTLDRDILEEVKSSTKEAFGQVVELFFESYHKHMENIEQALLQNDEGGISKDAHALKSVGAQIGAIQFSKIARDLEFEAKNDDDYQPDSKKISALCERLRQEFETLEPLLKQEL